MSAIRRLGARVRRAICISSFTFRCRFQVSGPSGIAYCMPDPQIGPNFQNLWSKLVQTFKSARSSFFLSLTLTAKPSSASQ